MRKIALALVLALSLGGCANLRDAVSIGTASVQNPVTRDRLYALEVGVDTVIIGLNAYRKECLAGRVDVNCKQNIRLVQPYVAQLPPLLTRLRRFVKTNDQVNAVSAFNELAGALGDAKGVAAQYGIKLPGGL